MTGEQKRAWLDQYSDDNVMGDDSNGLLCMDDFDDCIVGVAWQFGKSFVVYDREKVLQKLMDRDGMTREEAEEFHSYNQAGAWHGDHTPAFLDTPQPIGPDHE